MQNDSAFLPLLAQIKTTSAGGFFITGTDTDIGKTFVSCQLAQFLRQKQPGLVISARKPIASGAIRNSQNGLVSEDAQQLQQATGNHESLQTICPYLFEPAISPSRAIQQAVQQQRSKPITILDLTTACSTPKDHFALIEGAGGIYSPLAIDGLNIDLAKSLPYPVILVVGNKLGCINHALLSIQAIEHAQLPLLHIFLNQLTPSSDPNTLAELRCLTPYLVTEIPYQ